MKQKAILNLILIGLISFNFIGCTSSAKEIAPNNEQEKNISTENNKTNEIDINKASNNSDNETKNNTTINKNSQDDSNKVNTKKVDSSTKENNNVSKTQESTKQIYKNKLDAIELGMKDLDDLKGGSTLEMKSAAKEEYERWDRALNEIYGVLQKQLSSDDMNKLKDEEIKWIASRDEQAKKDSLKYKGGTAETLIYGMSLGQSTKERCYELVEKYMK
ncbi:lysozyme inhibitor LprI family protein [Clostridium botulinum]|uniref:lysozyme inhibitor LprI family protein n=1 Tax=Clostridium botulinum TaxID=1491 RepID=UPI000772DDCB|nr:lysozyme inhibitor LprI family protein [Clostridium botulinum]